MEKNLGSIPERHCEGPGKSMPTWMLTVVSDGERNYRGHLGYEDDPRHVYRYDSFVPNHKRVAVGDAVILRGRDEVHGSAVITRLEANPGTKQRLHCPRCNHTKLKQRRAMVPQFRCECGAEFEKPIERTASCTLYAAYFGDTFVESTQGITKQEFWECAPRPNKQLAILELDSKLVGKILVAAAARGPFPDQVPVAANGVFMEGARVTVSVSRYERDPNARRKCLEHHGYACVACGKSLEDIYGPSAAGVIEVHHLTPMCGGDGRRNVDPARDLRPLCPNCHTVAHTRVPPLTVEELQSLLVQSSTS